MTVIIASGYNRSIDRQRAELQTVAERLSLVELHDEEWNTLVLSDIVDSTNVWVVHPRNCMGLALEPIELVTLDTTRSGEHLDGYGPVKAGIPGVVHLAHPPVPIRATISYGTIRLLTSSGMSLTSRRRLAGAAPRCALRRSGPRAAMRNP